MVKYPGKLKYIVRKGATERVFKLLDTYRKYYYIVRQVATERETFPRTFQTYDLTMVKYLGKFEYIVREGATERVLKRSRIIFQRTIWRW